MKKVIYKAPLKVEVRPAGSKGRGVFAVKSIRKGELVEVAPGLLLGRGEAELAQMTDLGNYLFDQVGGGSLVGLGCASLYNHSKQCNCDYTAAHRTIVIMANRAIKAGEELTLDYGWDAEQPDRKAKNSK